MHQHGLNAPEAVKLRIDDALGVCVRLNAAQTGATPLRQLQLEHKALTFVGKKPANVLVYWFAARLIHRCG